MAKKKYVFTAARKRALKKAQAASRKKGRKSPKKRKNPTSKRKGGNPVAKKRKRSNPNNTAKKNNPRRKRNPYSRQSLTQMATTGALGVGGAVAGGFLANQLPIRDARLKAVAPALLALVLGSTRFVQRSPTLRAANMGLLVVGGLSLVRQFLPADMMLAGNQGVPVPLDRETAAMLGVTEDFAPEGDENMGVVEEFAGGGSSGFVSPADL